jgi:hypothetical protein
MSDSITGAAIVKPAEPSGRSQSHPMITPRNKANAKTRASLHQGDMGTIEHGRD